MVLAALAIAGASRDLGHSTAKLLPLGWAESLAARPSRDVTHEVSGHRPWLRHGRVALRRNRHPQGNDFLRQIHGERPENRGDQTRLPRTAWADDGDASLTRDHLRERGFGVVVAVQLIERNVIEGELVEAPRGLEGAGGGDSPKGLTRHSPTPY